MAMKWAALMGDCSLGGEETRLRLAILLTAAAAVLLGVAALQARPVVGPLGLIYSFSGSFYAGGALTLAGGACLWAISRRCTFLAGLQVVLLITYLWLVPTLLSSTPRFGSAYKAFGFADYIVRCNALQPENWQLWYHNWPGSSILVALMVQLMGPDAGRALMMFYPYGLAVVMLFPLWWLLRQGPWQRERPNAWAAGAMVFYLGNFINQDYLSPQSFGLFLLAYVLALTLSLTERDAPLSPQASTGLKTGLMLMLCTLAVSHVLSSLVALAVVAAYVLIRRHRPGYILLLGLVLLTSWNFAGASVYFEANFLSFLQQIVSFQSGWEANIGRRMSGSLDHLLVNRLRFLYCALFGVIGGLGFLLGRRRWGRRRALMLIMPAAPAAVLCGVMPYGGESYMRLFLFSLFALAFFSLGLAVRRWGAVALGLLLVCCCPLFMVAKYGNEQVEMIPRSVVTGAQWFATRAPAGDVLGAYPLLGGYLNAERFRCLRQPWHELEQNLDVALTPRDRPVYAGLTSTDVAFQTIFENDKDFGDRMRHKLDAAEGLDLIYHSPGFALYLRAPRTEEQGGGV